MAIYTTDDMKFGRNGFTSFRIEADISSPFSPLQRHIWNRADGSAKTDAWIPGGRDTDETLRSRGYHPVVEA